MAEKTVEVTYTSAPLNKKKTAVLVQALESLYEKHKVIRAADLLIEAANPRHPLHSEFEWSDKKAAEKYRLSQARQLIASVKIKIIDEEMSPEPVRAYVNVRPEAEDQLALPERGYMPTATAFTSTSYRRQVLSYAHAQLLRWKAKFGAFKEFAQLVQVIDTTKVE